MSASNPIQPLYTDPNGTIRFKSNKIVEYILERGRQYGVDLNHLACIDFSQDDREQFAQLIGYSLSGFSELSYVSDETYNTAENMAENSVDEKQARIDYLESELKFYREELPKLLVEPMAKVFKKHPEDLVDNGY